MINESIVKFKYLLEFILKVNNINYQEYLSNSDVNDFQIDQKQIIDNDFTYTPIEFNISFLALPKKKLFEIEIKNKNNYKKNISPKFQLGTKEKRTKNKIIKLSVKSMQDNINNNINKDLNNYYPKPEKDINILKYTTKKNQKLNNKKLKRPKSSKAPLINKNKNRSKSGSRNRNNSPKILYAEPSRGRCFACDINCSILISFSGFG